MTYARIDGGIVAETFTPPTGRTIADCFHDGLTWVDVTHVSPPPSAGWTAVETGGAWAFAAPVPAVVMQTLITPEDFIGRFSAAEQQAVVTAAASSWQVNLWLMKAVAATAVDVTDARTTAGMTSLVTAGVLTAGRSAQILNLAVVSP